MNLSDLDNNPEYQALNRAIEALEKQIMELEERKRIIRKPYWIADTNEQLAQFNLQIGDKVLIIQAFKDAARNHSDSWRIYKEIVVGNEAIVRDLVSWGIVIEYGHGTRGAWPTALVLDMRSAWLMQQQTT